MGLESALHAAVVGDGNLIDPAFIASLKQLAQFHQAIGGIDSMAVKFCPN